MENAFYSTKVALCNYLYDIFWKISEGEKITKQKYNNVSIGLFNIPCAGFGDIIVCKSFYDYFLQQIKDSNSLSCSFLTLSGFYYESCNYKPFYKFGFYLNLYSSYMDLKFLHRFQSTVGMFVGL